MITRPYLLHALSPLHAGIGHASDIIDLPTARMKATGIPFVPGSSIKGVLREARREQFRGDGHAESRTEAVFGPSDNPEAHAGALVVGDARLLALPVRTFRGTFAWITSPLLLTLARRDLGRSLAVPHLRDRGACVTDTCVCLHEGRLYLEDLDLHATESHEVIAWTQLLAPLLADGDDILTRRFAVVDDETMAFLWETATQVDARVQINPETRTVKSGALWLEESLPPETLLIGIVAGDRSRRDNVTMTPVEVLDHALGSAEPMQLGGKATIGRGRCKLIPIRGGSDART
jgi:CRISPR-associated protein Cmr4